jgi:hypothetical protein
MPRSNNSNNSYSSNKTNYKSYVPPTYTPSFQKNIPTRPFNTIKPIQPVKPVQPIQSIQPIQQRSFFGNIIDGFAFGTGSTIARNMFGSDSSRSSETKIIEKQVEKKVVIDCTEFNKCYDLKENGDKFLYNDCIKKLTNKISDYELCVLSR